MPDGKTVPSGLVIL